MTDVLPTALPAPKDFKDCLTDLLGRNVDVTIGTPVDPLATKATVAILSTDYDRPAAYLVCDLPATVYLGAAIGLTPPGGAQDAVDDKEVPPVIQENANEVLNVVSSLFNLPDHQHVRIYDVFPVGTVAPDAVCSVAIAPGRREDLNIAIAGYGTGRFSVVVVD